MDPLLFLLQVQIVLAFALRKASWQVLRQKKVFFTAGLLVDAFKRPVLLALELGTALGGFFASR